MNLTHGSVFGPFSHYMLWRHESNRGQEFSCWMVLDAERPDPLTGLPDVIRQAATVDAAVAGLDLSDPMDSPTFLSAFEAGREAYRKAVQEDSNGLD